MIRKVHGTDFKEMKAGLIMKYWNFTRRILLTLFFTTAVCPGLSQAVLHVNAASDDCSVTIGDGETSFSLDHAAVDTEDGHVKVTLSPEDYAELKIQKILIRRRIHQPIRSLWIRQTVLIPLN